MASMIVKHPVFDDVTETVDESVLVEWKAAGWKPLLDDAQMARLAEIEAEAQAAAQSDGDGDNTPPADDSGEPPASDEIDTPSTPRARKPRTP